MTSEVDIANLALGQAGTRSNISAFVERSREAAEIRLQYPVALESILSGAHWNFARRQMALTLIKSATSGDTTVPLPWTYEYAYPADCAQARYILPTVAVDASASVPGVPAPVTLRAPPPRFIISADVDDSGNDIKVILTNQPQAVLVYTKRMTNVAMYDGPFIQALAQYLAGRIAIPLTGDRGKMRDCVQLAQQMLIVAQASNGCEGLTVIDNTPDWISARGITSDYEFPEGTAGFWMAPQSLAFVT